MALAPAGLGVEADGATGEIYDKVRVFQEKPGTAWLVACFNRRTALLDRILEPLTPGAMGAFVRTDFGKHEMAAGLTFPRRWTTWSLSDIYARPAAPSRVDEIEVAVELKPPREPTKEDGAPR